uniref:Ig-like domain-containing protein n=1 Tax=Myotis lucifugus TaxID=59463 RepID=G1PTY2_MYOLU
MLPLLFSIVGMIFVLKDARAQSVSQPDHHVSVSEGASLELRCTYVYAATPSLFWYVQYPSQGLQLLLKNFSGKTLVQGIKGFEAEFKKNESSFILRKPSAHWSDSAVYFCALSDTVPEAAGGAAHKPLSGVFRDLR